MLVLLKKKKKEMLIEYCTERFGISKEYLKIINCMKEVRTKYT